MGLVKDLFFLGLFFTILSTVLQAQDAFVYYYDQQNSSELSQKIGEHRITYLILISLFGLINLSTLFLTPFFNTTTNKLVLTASLILLLKYVCELIAYFDFLAFLFELAAIFADIIGQSLFYLCSFRLVQIIIDRNIASPRAGLCYGIMIALYSLSMLLGYSFGFLCYQIVPIWLFLLILTALNIVSIALAYFTLLFEPQPQRQQLQQQQPQNTNNQAAQPQQNPFFKNNMDFKAIFNAMGKVYIQTIRTIPFQLLFGLAIAYAFDLLKFLQWISQQSATDSIDQNQTRQEYSRLRHTMVVLIVYCLGASIGSILGGFLIDRFNIKKVGFFVICFSFLSLAFLYIVIAVQKLVCTIIFFLLLGFTQFWLLTWIFSVCSRIFGGVFEALAATVQIIVISINGYSLLTVLFQDWISDMVKFCLVLDFMLALNIFAYFPFKKIPDRQVVIQFQEANLQQTNTSDTSRKANAQAQMTQIQKRVQANLQQQRVIDANVLI